MASNHGLRIIATAVLAVLLAGCGGNSEGRDAAKAGSERSRVANAAKEPQNWLSYNGNYEEQRYSTLDQINADTVAQLGLEWSFDFDTMRGQEATPLVVDGVLYTTTAWNKAYALDAATGRELWKYDPKVPGAAGLSACCDVVSRGAAYDDDKLFFATIDGRLIALDAKTGHRLWSSITVDQTKPYTITGAPRVARGKVFIGNGGAEYGVRGYVSAYDQKTGKLLWRFYTVPGDSAKPDSAASDEVLARLARPTWSGDAYWKIGGGGTVWDSIVYDPELNQLYFGTGNGGPWDHVIRSQGKGDNLFLASVVALDPDTGQYRWHYQENPGETWDFTSTQQIVLATLPIEGKPRKVLMHAPKNGFFYVIDRATGKPLSADKFVPANWAERIDLKTGRPVENPNARFKERPFLSTSGSSGAHNWHPMSFSPKTGLVYIPAQQIPILYARDPHFRYEKGLWALGIDLTAGGFPQTAAQMQQAKAALQGRLIAWDPVARKEVWRVEHGTAWNGGVLSTAGGLVFQGLADRTLRAYRADNGKELWKFDAQTRILAGAMTYSVKGIQYLAVTAGAGSTLALPAFDGPRTQPPGRMLVFRLGGKAKLPALTQAVPRLNDASRETWTAAEVDMGRSVYNRICAACHGAGTLSEGVVPDLKRSGILADPESWRQVVIGGLLQDRGMVSFAKYLSPAQAEAVRAYVNEETRKAKTRGMR